jgi:hypothetical protein
MAGAHRGASRSAPDPSVLPQVRYERRPGAASAPLDGPGYRRREPEKTVLHAVVREHLAGFLDEARARDGDGYPRFIEHEFRRYLNCGILARGFARLRCPGCGFERLVAFSCKGRLCPSCTGRRMSDIAAFLVDDLLPDAPYRQWVLTFPWMLRFRLAVDRPLFSALVRAYLHTLFAWQRRRGRAAGIADGATGAVTFVQRFGSILNLHPHIHSILPDGLFVPTSTDSLEFVRLPAPTEAELAVLAERVARRLTCLVERHAADDDRTSALFEETVASLRAALASSVQTPRLALDEAEPPQPASPLCARVAGFTLHAAQSVGAGDRAGLERLCRYGLRSPFSQERLSVREDGCVVYELRRAWPRPGGVTSLVLEPHAFLRRLAALTPSPYSHMVRYHGVFANRARLRGRLPAPPPAAGEAFPPEPATSVPPVAAVSSPLSTSTAPSPGDDASSPARRSRRRVPWAELLRRVFFVDALRCSRCAMPMVVLAFLTEPAVVTRILAHLGLPVEAPAIAPARGARGGGLFAGDAGMVDEPTGEEVARNDADPGDGFEIDRVPDDDEAPP